MKILCVWGERRTRTILTIAILILIGVLVVAGAELAVVLTGVGAAVMVATEAAERILGSQTGQAPA